jgi:hypothetical protein
MSLVPNQSGKDKMSSSSTLSYFLASVTHSELETESVRCIIFCQDRGICRDPLMRRVFIAGKIVWMWKCVIDVNELLSSLIDLCMVEVLFIIFESNCLVFFLAGGSPRIEIDQLGCKSIVTAG